MINDSNINKNSKLPLVSIVTPSYNQGRFIEETINSVRNQDYPNIEHIIIDGGSTDNTTYILKKYENTHRMCWSSEKDNGQADAISKGFKLSNGDIISWLNSDDIYLSTKVISEVVSFFKEYPQADIITGGGIIIDENSKWIQQILVHQKRICYKHLRYAHSLLQPATFFKSKVLDSIKVDITLHYAFDWDFFIKMSKQFNFLAVDEVWAGYRMWGRNKTSAGAGARARELLEVTGRYLGKKSWQYGIVGLFYLLYKVSEKMPMTSQKQIKKMIRKISLLVSLITFKRVTTV